MTGDELRELMRRFPAPVAVVTTTLDDERYGLTVGSLVSLSLQPPLVGISIGRESSSHEPIRRAGRFAVSLLSGEQEWVAQHFARSGTRRSRSGPVSRYATASADRSSRAPWRGSDAAPGPSTKPAITRSSSARCSAASWVPSVPASSTGPAATSRFEVMAVYTDITSAAAVVFDLDGVILDTEQLWDEVREGLARERGGRWS